MLLSVKQMHQQPGNERKINMHLGRIKIKKIRVYTTPLDIPSFNINRWLDNRLTVKNNPSYKCMDTPTVNGIISGEILV